MPEDISIWELRGSNRATRVAPIKQMETELLLEDVLTANPELVASGFTLVGRQTPIDGGLLDLLGVDAAGRLVVLELKRAQLTRDAVAQAIDYCSYLEHLADSELAELIADRSGTNGIRKITDFDSWYVERHGMQMDALRPVRMVLVGLGADARAERMVTYLGDQGVDISLLTFQAFGYEEAILLTRRDERHAAAPGTRFVRGTRTERLRALEERAGELGVEPFWRKATLALGNMFNSDPTQSGITFSLPPITVAGQSVRSSHSVTLLEPGGIRVAFFPVAVHLCQDRFDRERAVLPFQRQVPPNAPPVAEVSQQWACMIDEGAWEKHGDALTALAKDVRAAWTEHGAASAK